MVDPKLCKGPLDRADYIALAKAVAAEGCQWSRVAKVLPGRTDTQCRSRWLQVRKRKNPFFEALCRIAQDLDKEDAVALLSDSAFCLKLPPYPEKEGEASSDASGRSSSCSKADTVSRERSTSSSSLSAFSSFAELQESSAEAAKPLADRLEAFNCLSTPGRMWSLGRDDVSPEAESDSDWAEIEIVQEKEKMPPAAMTKEERTVLKQQHDCIMKSLNETNEIDFAADEDATSVW